MELFVPKPLVYKAKRQTPATEHQKERLRELMEQYGRKDSISWETLTRSEASRCRIRSGLETFKFFQNDFCGNGASCAAASCSCKIPERLPPV